MDKKKTNPLIIALLVVGIVGALGFAVKQVLNAMSPPPPPAEPPASTAAKPEPTKDEPVQTAKSVIDPMAAHSTNPFRPLAHTPSSASNQPSPAAPTQPPLPSPPPSVGPVPAPRLIANDRAIRSAALVASTAEGPLPAPSSAPSVAPSPSPAQPGAPAPMPVLVEPALMGTLLGGRPMAVFKSESGTVMVPQGGAYMGWRVLRVAHGEVTVWNGVQTLRLRVGGSSSGPVASAPSGTTAPGAIRTSAGTSWENEGYATANYVRVHYTGRPALSRREIVMGRREEPPISTAQENGGEPQPDPTVNGPSEIAPPSGSRDGDVSS